MLMRFKLIGGRIVMIMRPASLGQHDQSLVSRQFKTCDRHRDYLSRLYGQLLTRVQDCL